MTRRILFLGCLAVWLAAPAIVHTQLSFNPDVNRDGTVTSADVAIVRSLSNRLCGQAGFDPNADVNGDCRINTLDVNLVSQNLNLGITAAAVPAPNAAGWNNADVRVTFTCAGPATSCQADTDISTEGANQVVTGRVLGRSGARMTTSVTINLDKTAPGITIASPENGFSTTSSPISVNGTVATQLSPLTALTCGGAAVTPADAFTCTVPLVSGANTINVVGTDAAGNVGTRSISGTFDTAPPSGPPPIITISSPESLKLFNADGAMVTVRGTVSPADSEVIVTSPEATGGVIAGVGADGRWETSGVPLREGFNILTAKASKEGGVATTTVTVTLDTTPPVIRIDGPTDGAALTNTQAVITGVVNDIVAGTVNSEQVSVTVNGIPGAVSNRTFIVPEVLLVRGTNTLTAVATDRAGNQGQAEITVNVADAVGQQRIEILSGNGQTGVIGSVVPEALAVRLLDGGGQPVADRPVSFRVVKSDGVVAALDQRAQEVSILSDDNGEASVLLQLGSRSGVGNNQVAVSSAGFSGEIIFSASATVAPPALIKTVSGENQRGPVGQPLHLPFVVIVYDAGGNPVADVPVSFQVSQGGGSVEGQQLVVENTNSDGKADVLLTLGEQEGVNNQVVEASFTGGVGQPVVFSASGLVPGEATDTTVSGVVLDNTEQPIVGAHASLAGTQLSATTDSQGRFSIGSAPVGTVTLVVDASYADPKFPFLAFMLTTVAGTDNTVGMPIYIPALDTENSKIVGGDEETVLTMEGVPGVAFTVAANSTTLPNGSHQPVRMMLSQVHADKVPMPPPNGSAPRLVWTLQPANVHFNPPVRVQLPNTDGLAPGQVVEIYQFDHDLEQFVSVGAARVSPDGSVMTSDAGFGITKSGWGAPQPPPPPENCTAQCNDQNVCTSDTLNDPPCNCTNTPTNENGSCGGPSNPGPDSCRQNAKCIGGLCSGDLGEPGAACDDGVFCTDPDKCGSEGVLCFGEKIADQEGPSFNVEIKVADDIKGALNALKNLFGVFEEASIEVQIEGKQKKICCEEKQQKDVPIKTVKFQGNAKLETDKIFIPSLSFNVRVVRIGVFVKFGVQGSAFLEAENNQCTENWCWKGGIQIAGIVEGGVAAEAGEVVSISGSCETGLQVDANVSCKEYQLGLSHSGFKCKFSVELFDGFIVFNVEKELIAPGPLIGGTPKPLPEF